MQVNNLTYDRMPRSSQVLIGAIGLAVMTMSYWLALPAMFSSDTTTIIRWPAELRAAQPTIPAAAVKPDATDRASPISPSAPEKDNGALAAGAPPATDNAGAIADIPPEFIPLPKPRRVAAVPVPRARPQIEPDEPPAPASAPPPAPQRTFFDFFSNR